MSTLASVVLRDTLVNRPAAGIAGRLFYDTTNSQLQRDNGSSWDAIEGAGGATDHGALTGLADDDHPQYATNTEFDSHASRHEAGGADEIDVTGLTGAGGGGGATIQYGSLKPATPLDDFDGASLDGAWSAHQNAATFGLGNCFTQAIDGSHVSMGIDGGPGQLYRATTNIDQDWYAFGLRGDAAPIGGAMIGIAIIDTSGNGVGVVAYGDGNAYLALIASWAYSSALQTFTGYGTARGFDQVYSMRLNRTGNTWDAWISIDGNTWVHSPATSNSTITAAHRAVGHWFSAGKGRVICDAVDD